MHMSYCFTCTCKTTLHTETSYITLRDGALLISEKEINGNNGRHLAQNWTVLSVFHHSSTEYYLSDKTRINTERRLEDCSSLSYICFPLRKSAIICVSIKIQTLWNSVLLCGEIHSKPHSNEDDGPVFSVAEVPLNGIDPLVRCCTLAFSERNVPFPGTGPTH